MSWIGNLVGQIFPQRNDSKSSRKLPHPPSIMAGGSPWYEDVSLTKEEVNNKIKKDILSTHPNLKTLNLSAIIDEVVGDTEFDSYRGYLTFSHNNFVKESRELALEKYDERHQKNMFRWYVIARLKSTVRKIITNQRNKRRHQFWRGIEKTED